MRGRRVKRTATLLLFRLYIRPLKGKAHTQLEALLENLDLPFGEKLVIASRVFFQTLVSVCIKCPCECGLVTLKKAQKLLLLGALCFVQSSDVTEI